MSLESPLEQDQATGSHTIREDIEATRARMGHTLEELGERLNPERLKQQAKDTLREATIGRMQTMAQQTLDKANTAGRGVVGVVRDNPLPAAMIAVGLGWLVWKSRKGPTFVPVARPTEQLSQPYLANTGGSPRVTVDDHGLADSVREKASAVVDGAQEAAHRAKEGAAQVIDQAQHAAERVKDGASHAASTAAHAVTVQSERVAIRYRDNPLVIGAVVAAVGLAIGFAFPSTEKEGELVGGARDDLMDKARELVHEKTEQAEHVVQRVASEARSVVTEAAREEGLL